VLLKPIFDLLKTLSDDKQMKSGCKLIDPAEAKHLHETKLKNNYDEVLLVVHPGYGLLTNEFLYKNKQGYEKYIRELKIAINKAKENGDLVVFLVGAENIREGKSLNGLGISDADLTIATHTHGPMPVTCIETVDHNFIYQKIDSLDDLFDLFQEKSVKKVKLAGENEHQCVGLVKKYLEENDFPIEVLEEATYSPLEN